MLAKNPSRKHEVLKFLEIKLQQWYTVDWIKHEAEEQ